MAFTCLLQQREHEVTRAILPLSVDEFVERFTPLFGLVGIDINHLISQARMNDASAWVRQVTFGHGGDLSSMRCKPAGLRLRLRGESIFPDEGFSGIPGVGVGDFGRAIFPMRLRCLP
ncbi:unannotated protein [freshwater metagenome]|uniref:Unannotated protein n=1 Tax=freshwater metagenome TaxID=449393 RepID=A0A6J7EIJ0_9ZZZZ